MVASSGLVRGQHVHRAARSAVRLRRVGARSACLSGRGDECPPGVQAARDRSRLRQRAGTARAARSRSAATPRGARAVAGGVRRGLRRASAFRRATTPTIRRRPRRRPARDEQDARRAARERGARLPDEERARAAEPRDRSEHARPAASAFVRNAASSGVEVERTFGAVREASRANAWCSRGGGDRDAGHPAAERHRPSARASASASSLVQ